MPGFPHGLNVSPASTPWLPVPAEVPKTGGSTRPLQLESSAPGQGRPTPRSSLTVLYSLPHSSCDASPTLPPPCPGRSG